MPFILSSNSAAQRFNKKYSITSTTGKQIKPTYRRPGQNKHSTVVPLLCGISASNSKLPILDKYVVKTTRADNKFIAHPGDLQLVPRGTTDTP